MLILSKERQRNIWTHHVTCNPKVARHKPVKSLRKKLTLVTGCCSNFVWPPMSIQVISLDTMSRFNKWSVAFTRTEILAIAIRTTCSYTRIEQGVCIFGWLAAWHMLSHELRTWNNNLHRKANQFLQETSYRIWWNFQKMNSVSSVMCVWMGVFWKLHLVPKVGEDDVKS